MKLSVEKSGVPQAEAHEASLRPPERTSLSDGIVVQIQEAIQRGDFAPGEHLSEEALARQLRVSRGPVRDALKQLERDGLVVSQPNGRKFVAHITLGDIEEIFSLRLVLEKLAVQRACRLADAAGIARLRAVVEDMAASVRDGVSKSEALELDLRLHDALYEASGHRRLMNLWSILRPQVLVFLHARMTSRLDFADILVPYHHELVEAIAAGDEETAAAAIEIHIRSAYEPLMESYG